MLIQVLLCCFSLFVISNTLAAEVDSVQRLEDVQAEIKILSNALDLDKKTRSALYRQLKEQSQAVSTLNRELRILDQQLEQKKRHLNDLEEAQDAFRQSHAKQLIALNAQLRAAYMNSQPHYLQVLLNQQTPAKLSRTNTYFHYFHEARQTQLVTISDNLKGLDNNKQSLLAARHEQELMYQQRKTQQQRLGSQNKQRLVTAKQLDHRVNKQGLRVISLKEEAQALRDLLQSLAQAKPSKAISTKPFATLKGQLSWPVKGIVTTHYGSSRQLGKLTWQGILIKSSTGKEIHSAAAGRVVFSDWLRGFGLLLIIDHGDNYMTLYGNNESLLREVGDTVNANELVALSGNQGIKRYAGLYFELRHQGNPTDPIKWLGKRS
ncbi:MAG: septal ring factor EnvC (AmiA/AmiB activator) [Methylophagaceae bacterium]|jgi:septal ring factor EnvC (AmiA/AmiB activator)